MAIHIFVAYPPDRDGRVVQLMDRHDGTIDIPAEICRDGNQAMITLFPHADGPAWTCALDDFVAAIESAVAALDAPPQRA